MLHVISLLSQTNVIQDQLEKLLKIMESNDVVVFQMPIHLIPFQRENNFLTIIYETKQKTLNISNGDISQLKNVPRLCELQHHLIIKHMPHIATTMPIYIDFI